jgi:hypothetical protein
MPENEPYVKCAEIVEARYPRTARKLDAWAVGDGLTDGWMEIKRTPAGFTFYDPEAGDTEPRIVDRDAAITGAQRITCEGDVPDGDI